MGHNINYLKLMLQKHEENIKNISFANSSTLKCECGQLVVYNGITSHSKICLFSDLLKVKYKKNKFYTNENCPICNTKLTLTGRRHFVFCNGHCTNRARQIINDYEKKNTEYICATCNKIFKSTHKRNTCSDECCNQLLSKRVTAYHMRGKTSDNASYRERNEKIGKSRIGKSHGVVWNKGLSGYDYMKHYEKPDGTNSFYEALKKNDGWFKKTAQEKKFEEFLLENHFNYQYSFFACHRQFDFLVSTDNDVFIIELDGDYWHKSRRLSFTEDEIQIARKLDQEKEAVLFSLKFNKRLTLLRIWEYDINNNETLFTVLTDIFKGTNVDENISKIKEYYKIYY